MRSSMEKIARLAGLEPMATMSLSKRCWPRWMTSRWPLVIGSNVPGKSPILLPVGGAGFAHGASIAGRMPRHGCPRGAEALPSRYTRHARHSPGGYVRKHAPPTGIARPRIDYSYCRKQRARQRRHTPPLRSLRRSVWYCPPHERDTHRRPTPTFENPGSGLVPVASPGETFFFTTPRPKAGRRIFLIERTRRFVADSLASACGNQDK